jgi:ABC-type lipoprotein export system ATPase subunit
MDSLRELHRGVGIPVVLVTHDEQLVSLANRPIHLADGKIISVH